MSRACQAFSGSERRRQGPGPYRVHSACGARPDRRDPGRDRGGPRAHHAEQGEPGV